MTTALSQSRGVKELALLAMGVALSAALMFGAAAPRAQAAALTEPQIQAILNLLAAFNVPQAEIDNVEGILHQSK
ncbi:MAG: hypothetical protein KA066_02455 [Candidatus Pacebacteria bacterium]|nr:hypothetical protein [Candidatus Paceibacterota bacterium]